MNPFDFSMQQAVAGMRQIAADHGERENVSNADTPGYKRKILVSEPPTGSEVSFAALRTVLDQTPGATEFNPEHPMADQEGYVTLSNVSL